MAKKPKKKKKGRRKHGRSSKNKDRRRSTRSLAHASSSPWRLSPPSTPPPATAQEIELLKPDVPWPPERWVEVIIRPVVIGSYVWEGPDRSIQIIAKAPDGHVAHWLRFSLPQTHPLAHQLNTMASGQRGLIFLQGVLGPFEIQGIQVGSDHSDVDDYHNLPSKVIGVSKIRFWMGDEAAHHVRVPWSGEVWMQHDRGGLWSMKVMTSPEPDEAATLEQ